MHSEREEKDEGLPPGISEKASGTISKPKGQCLTIDFFDPQTLMIIGVLIYD
jgi:hypothetical protein